MPLRYKITPLHMGSPDSPRLAKVYGKGRHIQDVRHAPVEAEIEIRTAEEDHQTRTAQLMME